MRASGSLRRRALRTPSRHPTHPTVVPFGSPTLAPGHGHHVRLTQHCTPAHGRKHCPPSQSQSQSHHCCCWHVCANPRGGGGCRRLSSTGRAPPQRGGAGGVASAPMPARERASPKGTQAHTPAPPSTVAPAAGRFAPCVPSGFPQKKCGGANQIAPKATKPPSPRPNWLASSKVAVVLGVPAGRTGRTGRAGQELPGRI